MYHCQHHMEASSCERTAGLAYVQIRTWKVSPDLFPVDLSPAAQSAATAAVEAAVAAWGERAISELEAEDRLAFACEKAPTEDPVTAQVGCRRLV